MVGKKGLSDVVTNVLIILLVLIAITLVWFFVSGTIRTGAGQTAGAADCLTISVEPIKCSALDDKVTIKRNVGSGSLYGMKFVVTSGGADVVYDGDPLTAQELDVLETAVFDLSSVNGADLRTGDIISVAPVVGDSKSSKTCPVSPVEVTCA